MRRDLDAYMTRIPNSGMRLNSVNGFYVSRYLEPERISETCDSFGVGLIIFNLLYNLQPFHYAHDSDPHYIPLATDDYRKFWHIFGKKAQL